MGIVKDNVKRLLRYNNIRYREFSERIGLGVGTIRSAFSRDKDEVWMRAFEYGYELGKKCSRDMIKFGNGDIIDGGGTFPVSKIVDDEKISWQERLEIQKVEGEK